MRISKRIELLRTAKGMTQAKLGKASGVCKTKISDIETESVEATADDLARFARALGVPVSMLTGESVYGESRLPIDFLLLARDFGFAVVGPFQRENGEIDPVREYPLDEVEIAAVATARGRRALATKLHGLYRASFAERLDETSKASTASERIAHWG